MRLAVVEQTNSGAGPTTMVGSVTCIRYETCLRRGLETVSWTGMLVMNHSQNLTANGTVVSLQRIMASAPLYPSGTLRNGGWKQVAWGIDTIRGVPCFANPISLAAASQVWPLPALLPLVG